jgi:hypothetical protein
MPRLNVSKDISMIPCLKSGCNLRRLAIPSQPEQQRRAVSSVEDAEADRK